MSVLSAEELAEAVDVVCMTVFDMPVSASGQTGLLDDECMQVRIDISGAWQGRIQVRANQQFLCLAASRVFLKKVDAVDQQDCIDTLTEMTNMLGGTVKCMLPGPSTLGLPIIVNCDQDETSDDEWHCFDCDHQPMAVAIVEAIAKETQAA